LRITAIVLAAATALAVLFVTHTHGLGLSPDALSYLGAADSLAHGRGLRVPMADWYEPQSTTPLRHFPPAFSALLALPMLLGIGALDAARVPQALLAGALVWLACALACSACPARSTRAPVLLSAALLLVTPAWNQGVLLALSEPLFLSLLALTVLLMVRAPERLLLLGSVTACCALVRYAGVAAPLAAATFVATRPVPPRQRAHDVVLVLIPPVLAIALWHHWAGHFREYGLFTAGWGTSLAEALATTCDWLAPWPLPIWMRVCCVALGISACVRLANAQLRDERSTAAVGGEPPGRLSRLVRATSVLCASYAAVLLFSRLCADPDIPFDWRILSPFIVAATWLMAAVIALRWGTLRASLRAALALYVVLWFGGNLATSAGTVTELLRRGMGYGAEAWQDAGVARWLRGPGRRYALYTNDPAAVWLVGRQPARMLPKADELKQLPAFTKQLRSAPSAIIGFPQSFDPTLDPAVLAEQVGFVEVARFENASVWTARQPTQRALDAVESAR
jgi:hypothetical protein